MSRPYGVLPPLSPAVIVPGGRCSMPAMRELIVSAAASGASPWSDAADGLLAYPFVVEAPTLINKFFWVNGTSVTTSTSDMALYDASFNKVGTATGSITNANINVPQATAPSGGAFTIPPGLYYCAITHAQTTTGHFFRWSSGTFGIAVWKSLGCWKMAAQAAGSTPATATPGAITNVAFPLCGIVTRSAFDL